MSDQAQLKLGCLYIPAQNASGSGLIKQLFPHFQRPYPARNKLASERSACCWRLKPTWTSTRLQRLMGGRCRNRSFANHSPYANSILLWSSLVTHRSKPSSAKHATRLASKLFKHATRAHSFLRFRTRCEIPSFLTDTLNLCRYEVGLSIGAPVLCECGGTLEKLSDNTRAIPQQTWLPRETLCSTVSSQSISPTAQQLHWLSSSWSRMASTLTK